MKKLSAIILMLSLGLAPTMRADTVPITSAEFAVATISRFELRRIYFMKDRWVDGVGLITLFQRPKNSEAHLRFIRETLGLTPAAYFKELALAVNSGKGVTITVVDNDEDMIEKVTTKDNAIGYLDVDTLIITLDKSTRLLKVSD
jgi:hypothetical protein